MTQNQIELDGVYINAKKKILFLYYPEKKNSPAQEK